MINNDNRTSALGDRFKIASQGDFPEAELAPQVLVNCVNGSSCDGGTLLIIINHF